MRNSLFLKPLLWLFLAMMVFAVWFKPSMETIVKKPQINSEAFTLTKASPPATQTVSPARSRELDSDQSKTLRVKTSPQVPGDNNSQKAMVVLLDEFLASRLTAVELDELLGLVPEEVLITFFEQTSSINRRWLINNGLSSAQLVSIYRTLAMAPAMVDLGDAVLADGVSNRALRDGSYTHYTNAIFNLDKSVFIHTKLPNNITSGSVIARWVNLDAPDFSHFDAYPLRGSPQEIQELWLRQPDGWQPGSYRLEIYTPEGAAGQGGPVSYFEFEVYEYGAR